MKVSHSPPNRHRLNCGNEPFSELCRVFESLSQPFARPAAKMRVIERLIAQYDASVDLYPLMRLIIPQLDSERNSYDMKEANLARLYGDIIGLPHSERDKLKHFKDPQRIEGTKARAGDFGAVLYAVIQSRMQSSENPQTIDDVNSHLDAIQSAVNLESKRKPFATLIRLTSPIEQKWIARIILKDMKLGLSPERMLKILHPTAVSIYNTCSDIKEVLQHIRAAAASPPVVDSTEPVCLPGQNTEGNSSASKFAMFKPLRPMLAERISQGIELDLLFRLDKNKTISAIDDPHCPIKYYVENKLDGERIMCHISRNGDANYSKRVEFYTRRGNDYTYLYHPSLGDLICNNVRGCKLILDGEMLSWDSTSNSYIPFGSNKTVAQGHMMSANLCYVVFDILYFANIDGEHDLASYCLSDRRQFLQKVVKSIPHRFEIIDSEVVTGAARIRELLNEVMDKRQEGLMIKFTDSTYQPNARRGGWCKLKPLYGSLNDTMDLLVVGGYFGDGVRRRIQDSHNIADHISHFLLAVLADESIDPNETSLSDRRVFPFCKVGTGFSFHQLTLIRSYIRTSLYRYTNTDCAPWFGGFKFEANDRPDVIWRPSDGFVMEVMAAEIIPSTKFETGVTLRFPRAIKPFRDDKSWSCAMTVSELKVLTSESWKLKADPMKSQRSRGSETEDESTEIYPAEKVDRRGKKHHIDKPSNPDALSGLWSTLQSAQPKLLPQYIPTKTIETTSIRSYVFEEKEFYVISGAPVDSRFQKQELEKLILQHGGSISQAYRRTHTAHVIAAEASFRTRSINRVYNIPVIHFSYLFECIEVDHIVPLQPKYLIHSTPELHNAFYEDFDKFGDSYFTDIVNATELQALMTSIKAKRLWQSTDKAEVSQLSSCYTQSLDLPENENKSSCVEAPMNRCLIEDAEDIIKMENHIEKLLLKLQDTCLPGIISRIRRRDVDMNPPTKRRIFTTDKDTDITSSTMLMQLILHTKQVNLFAEQQIQNAHKARVGIRDSKADSPQADKQ